ncbi:MAG TPA: hypothetical protein VN238_20505 [Solirubrobacteraceae bacterium]|nr:hypothetical protein [Solirubrobacteraceae bacterium]
MSRGLFYFRCDSDDWDFLAALATPLPFDAAVISDRYLAEYPKGHKREDEPRDRLVSALSQLGAPWALDPDTARLEQSSSATRQRPRAANRPLARALPLPLAIDRLARRGAVETLLGASVLHQVGSPAFAVPYLEVSGLDDPRFAINLQLLDGALGLAGDRRVVAYLQVLRSRLVDGTARSLVRRLVASGAQTVFVRVRRLDAEQATAEELLAYAGVIQAGIDVGGRVVPDCVGRLGPTLVATGADGFSAGAKHFRKLSDDLHPVGGGGGVPLLWEEPGRTQAAESASASPRCPVPSCPAPDGPGPDHAATRVHNLHEFKGAARLAGREGLAYAARLLSSPSPVAQVWGSALQELARRAA